MNGFASNSRPVNCVSNNVFTKTVTGGAYYHRTSVGNVMFFGNLFDEDGTFVDGQVVAEGVETDQHLNILREMGCDSIQGYLISRPVPEDELHDILSRQQQDRAGDGPA